MERRIVGFHQDDERHWVAELECGHNQHVRHHPPWTVRPWVSSAVVASVEALTSWRMEVDLG
jgi:hypothetical protein